MYKAVIFSSKVSQNFIVYESAEDRNLRGIFNPEKKNTILQYFYQIVLQLKCLTYLPKMNLFPWTAFLPEGFENGIIQKVLDRRLYGVGQHFTFSKMKILSKLWLWFSKMFHQRVLSDSKWSISKFQFWRRIVDIYRQPLLKMKTLFKWGLKLLLKYKIVIKAFANQRHHQGWENIPHGAIFIFKNRCNLLVCAEI